MKRLLRMALAVVAGLAAVMLVAAGPDSQASTAPDRWAERMAAFEAQDRASPPQPDGIAFIGSSSINRWHEIDRRFANLHPLRRGLDGATLAVLTERLPRLVLRHAPRLLVVYGGDNDLAAGATPEQVLTDWRALVARVHAELPQTRIAFLSIKPSPRRAAMLPRVRRANALVAADARRDGRLSYIDIHTPMLDERGRPRADLYRPDGLHLNDAGYALWTATVATRLNAGRAFPGAHPPAPPAVARLDPACSSPSPNPSRCSRTAGRGSAS